MDDDDQASISTNRWHQRRPTASAALLVALGVEQGVRSEDLLRDTGLDLVQLHDPAAEIDADQELRLIDNLVAQVDVPDLGFIAGERYHFGLHGIWTYAVINSRDLRVALEIGTRYAELTYSFLRPAFVIAGDEGRMHLNPDDLPARLVRFLIERDLQAASAVFLALTGLPGLPASSARLPYARPTDEQHLQRYVDLLGVEPEWGTGECWLGFHPALLDLPIPSASARAAADAERACAELLTRRRRRSGFAAEVREVLARGRVTTDQAEVAATLHVSLRTLRRRLAEEGTTYRELAQETWGLLAEELLRSGLTVEQVADRLGYGGASSFTRSFKAWKGVSPGTFARQGTGT
ncbi:MAG TPA: AraC family transcriptional regulator [Acidimicrobiales bacterium]|nr:AraC family transcriptional regulator [Acidimicrobiales bacterium]